MPNPVVSFEIRGPDTAALRKFYTDVFGWEMFQFAETYAGVETSTHTHDEATGATTYTGADAFMNDGVMILTGVPWHANGADPETGAFG